MRQHVYLLLLCIVLISLVMVPKMVPGFKAIHTALGSIDGTFTPGTAIFTGDIMLGRAVERIMNRTDDSYPFLRIENIISHADVAVGNFEASIPEIHTETPDFGFQLSVRSDYVSAIKKHGFDIVGIANNHAFDFGMSGLTHMRSVLEENELTVFGDPNEVNESSTAVVSLGSSKLGILAVHAVYKDLDIPEIKKQIQNLDAKSNLVLVYIHWGTEYETLHTKEQERMAHALIDAGADGVIGHHPHVVEDIEVYNGKPIFYSLGNLIFDQYFSEEVERGLLVEVSILPDTVVFTPIPVSSIKSRSQPSLFPVDEQNAVLTELFMRSTSTLPWRVNNSLHFPR